MISRSIYQGESTILRYTKSFWKNTVCEGADQRADFWVFLTVLYKKIYIILFIKYTIILIYQWGYAQRRRVYARECGGVGGAAWVCPGCVGIRGFKSSRYGVQESRLGCGWHDDPPKGVSGSQRRLCECRFLGWESTTESVVYLPSGKAQITPTVCQGWGSGIYLYCLSFIIAAWFY